MRRAELPMPEGLTALVERIREGSYASRCARGRTPTSEEVARSMPWISKLQELAAQQHLQDALGYPGERELRKDKE